MVEAAVYATRTYGGVRGVKPYSMHKPGLHKDLRAAIARWHTGLQQMRC